MTFRSGPYWNRTLGWLLLIAGFVWAAWLDPWSLSVHGSATWLASIRAPLRQAQAVVLAMAFLQLIIARLLAVGPLPMAARLGASALTGIGAILYTLGYLLVPFEFRWAGLIPAGAAANGIGCLILAFTYPGGRQVSSLRILLTVIAFGMLLNTLMGLFTVAPRLFQPLYIGPEDGVRQRMLRLARVAAVALPVLALLYDDLAGHSNRRQTRTVMWGQLGMVVGAVGMPLVLMAAAFTFVPLKYLLPIPALSVFGATVVGVGLATRDAPPLERLGWILIAVSMAGGLLMGLYAFDGPLRSPAFLGDYNDFARRLSRLGHAYCIVLGLLSIFVSRELAPAAARNWPARIGVPLLAGGTLITLITVVLVADAGLAPRFMEVGPTLVAVATVLCVGAAWRNTALPAQK